MPAPNHLAPSIMHSSQLFSRADPDFLFELLALEWPEGFFFPNDCWPGPSLSSLLSQLSKPGRTWAGGSDCQICLEAPKPWTENVTTVFSCL